MTSQDCFFDLVDFAKRQWNEQYHNLKGPEYSFEEEATASDVAEFPLADLQGLERGRAVRDFDATSIPSIALDKEREVASKDASFSRQLSAGCVDSMATNPLSAAVAGTEDRIGGLGTPTQAARGGRPDGDVGTGDRATRHGMG